MSLHTYTYKCIHTLYVHVQTVDTRDGQTAERGCGPLWREELEIRLVHVMERESAHSALGFAS